VRVVKKERQRRGEEKKLGGMRIGSVCHGYSVPQALKNKIKIKNKQQKTN